jgi:hypothetical protein
MLCRRSRPSRFVLTIFLYLPVQHVHLFEIYSSTPSTPGYILFYDVLALSCFIILVRVEASTQNDPNLSECPYKIEQNL